MKWLLVISLDDPEHRFVERKFSNHPTSRAFAMNFERHGA
jgi:hypothetical protein